jgi:hypothetical protein
VLIKSLLATVYSVFLFQGKLTPADGRLVAPGSVLTEYATEERTIGLETIVLRHAMMSSLKRSARLPMLKWLIGLDLLVPPST